MSGSGRKVFQPGEVLTASNVQNYLMDQAVQYYAGTAARGSAIGTATTEGMMSYLADSNQLQVATGTATWQNVSMVQSPNFLLNGDFSIWQRGTAAVTTNGNYSADRWIIGSAAGTNSVTQSTDVPSGIGATYSISFAGTSTTNPRIRQRIEALNASALAGQTVTLSFYAKSSVGSAPIKVDTGYPTTTADTFGTWASPTVTADQSGLAVTPTGNASTSWTRYTVSFVVSASATKGYQIDLYRESTTTSTTTLFCGVQLEIGETATPFQRNQKNIQSELAACQRYFYRLPGLNGIIGATNATNTIIVRVNYPVTFRTAPSLSVTAGSITVSDDYSVDFTATFSSTSNFYATVSSARFWVVTTSQSANYTVGRWMGFGNLNGGTGSANFDFSAEL